MLGGDITVSSQPGVGSTFTATIATGPLRNVRMLNDIREADGGQIHEPLQMPEEQQAQKPPSLPASILLAEDGPDNQRLIRTFLEKAGATVTIVDNGRAAVEHAQDAVEREQPYDIVLMDMQMPELDGYEATRRLREQGYDRPIIALTAHAMAGDRDRCLDAGCNDYLAKPIDRSRLIVTISGYLKDAPADPADTTASASEASDAVVAAAARIDQPDADGASGDNGSSKPAENREPGDDAAESQRAEQTCPLPAGEPLLSDFADDPEMAELLEGFVTELPDRIYQIEKAAQEKDLASLASLAHQLKGAAGGYGFSPITEAARAVERQAKEELELEQIRTSVDSLKELCLRAMARPQHEDQPR